MSKSLTTTLIKLDIYDTGFYLLLGGTAKDIREWQRKHLEGYDIQVGNLNEYVGGVWTPKNKETGHKTYILWLQEMKKTNTNIAVVVHEVTHLIAAILRYKGLRLTGASEEAYAYANEYAVRRTLDTMDKKKLWL